MHIRLIRTFYLFVILFFSNACNLNGKSPSPDNAPKFGKVVLQYSDTTLPEYKRMIYRLDTFYQRQIATGFNGSVLIGYKGKILYERYFGISQKETGERWSTETRSQLASTSKTLTSGAICILKDKGLLSFDDLVTKFIPNFPYPTITLRMLLCHRSGLADYVHFAAAPKGKLYLSNEDIVNLFANNKPKLQFVPNTRFTYCNSNFAILASVVEHISGMRFDYFMKRFVFGPIGMDHTYVINPNEEQKCNSACCYNYKWVIEKDMHLDGVAGDKGVYSSVRDLYKWDQALYSGKFIMPSTLKEAFAPYSFERPGVKNYGLGWRMLNYPNGMKIVYHNGWWHGNNTCFYRFIQDNFTIIVLGNKYNKNIYHQPQQIYNIVMGDDPSKAEMNTEE